MVVEAMRSPDGATRLQRVHYHLTGINDPDNVPFFSAFAADGTHLGTWSPSCPERGWALFRDGVSLSVATAELFRIKTLAAIDAPDSEEAQEARRCWQDICDWNTIESSWTRRAGA